jgi:hypothetical protein
LDQPTPNYRRITTIDSALTLDPTSTTQVLTTTTTTTLLDRTGKQISKQTSTSHVWVTNTGTLHGTTSSLSLRGGLTLLPFGGGTWVLILLSSLGYMNMTLGSTTWLISTSSFLMLLLSVGIVLAIAAGVILVLTKPEPNRKRRRKS